MCALKILHVAGARPNFMKVAPIIAAMARRGGDIEQQLLHTGQHYDENMSRVFFDQLGLPRPDVNLEVGSGTHAQQTARIMQAFEPVVLASRPDWVSVVGDVNSTLACSLVCAKLEIPVAHVEAGLRSFDRTMPEEINRIITDQLADLLFTPSRDGDENLLREGISPDKIHFVGNVMIDTLLRLLPQATPAGNAFLERLARERKTSGAPPVSDDFVLVTLHRPANVDDSAALAEILRSLADLSRDRTVIFPVHPRTRGRIADGGFGADLDGLLLIEPVGYLEFVGLMSRAALVLTDSGGIQEETTVLGVPCLTVRPNTERPITITEGTNRLVDCRHEAILEAASVALRSAPSASARPELWDGHAAVRIVEVFLRQN
ncbi:MAG: UDP-N-acetylglucosamine 2-epimerase (non-hydrolyzing) [bacterium]